MTIADPAPTTPTPTALATRFRVLIAGLWHETNTFSPIATDLDAFRRYQFAEGPAVLSTYRDTNTEIGGMIAASAECGLDLVPVLFAGAVPAGTVTADCFDHLASTITSAARENGPFDGVLLALHGAMVAEGEDEADAAIVERVRAVAGAECPIIVTFDLHANLSQRLVTAADVLIGYDTFPHVDMGERGREAVRALADLMAGAAKPAKAYRKLPLVTVPQMQTTAERPMREIMAMVASAEQEAGIRTISVAQGFAYADVEHLGVAVVGYGEGAQRLGEAVDAIADALQQRSDAFQPELLAVDQAVSQARTASTGPVVLVEPADNVGGGAPGDGTEILAALIASETAGTIVIWDPEAAKAAGELSLGGAFDATVGGRALPKLHGAPAQLSGTIVFSNTVTYERDGPYMTGQQVAMGLVAVVETAAGLKVVLTSERVMPFDDTHLRVLGIEPAQEPILVAKSGSAWKAAFGGYVARAIVVDTGGVCSSNLERLPYTHGPLTAKL